MLVRVAHDGCFEWPVEAFQEPVGCRVVDGCPWQLYSTQFGQRAKQLRLELTSLIGGSSADVCRCWLLQRQFPLLSIAARLRTILRSISEAPMVPAGACCIVGAGGQIVVEAVISGLGRAISLVVATVPEAGTAVPMRAKGRYLAG
jgi:hypothetical protein